MQIQVILLTSEGQFIEDAHLLRKVNINIA